MTCRAAGIGGFPHAVHADSRDTPYRRFTRADIQHVVIRLGYRDRAGRVFCRHGKR